MQLKLATSHDPLSGVEPASTGDASLLRKKNASERRGKEELKIENMLLTVRMILESKRFQSNA